MKKFLIFFILGIFAIALIIGAINDEDDESMPFAFVEIPDESVSDETIIEAPKEPVEGAAPEPMPETQVIKQTVEPSSVEIPRLTEPMQVAEGSLQHER